MEGGFSTASAADVRHEIEENVQTAIYPGTEVMTDSMSAISLADNTFQRY